MMLNPAGFMEKSDEATELDSAERELLSSLRMSPETLQNPTVFSLTRAALQSSAITIALVIVLSGINFTTLVLTTYALKTSILLPLVLAIVWRRTNTLGFVGGIALAILIGMPLRQVYGELIGTISILAISGLSVVIGAFLKPDGDFNYAELGAVSSIKAQG